MTKARDLANIANGVPNSLITLDANEIPNLDTAKITTGTFADARISQSSVSQHATSFDDSKIQQDLMVLALQQATDANKAAYSLSNSFVEQFEDSTGIDVQTNTTRDASEYISSVQQTNDANTIELFKADSLTTGDFTGQEIVGARGLLKIIENSNSGQSVVNDFPYSGKSFRSIGWSVSGGFRISDIAGQTSPLNFGSGSAFTFECWVKPVNTGWSNTHQYIFDIATGANANRLSITPSGTVPADPYNGNFINYDNANYSWNDFSTSSWRHVAYVRNTSGNHAVFINGSRVAYANATNSSAINYTGSSSMAIGDRHSFTGEGAYINVADFRISNVARYSPTSSSYTVPSTRFQTYTETVSATGNFTSVSKTAPATVSKMGIVVLYKNNAGTATLNTDLVAQVSANNGTDFTTVTLTPRGTFSTGINIAVANNVTVTSGTSCKYKISFANQSAGTKETQVHGVGLIY